MAKTREELNRMADVLLFSEDYKEPNRVKDFSAEYREYRLAQEADSKEHKRTRASKVLFFAFFLGNIISMLMLLYFSETLPRPQLFMLGGLYFITLVGIIDRVESFNKENS